MVRKTMEKALGRVGVPRGIGVRADEREGSTEAQDVCGTRVRLNRYGLAYGEEFVPFDEMSGTRPVSWSLWNPVTNPFEVAVVRHNGPDLIVKNLPPGTAERLGAAISAALSERGK